MDKMQNKSCPKCKNEVETEEHLCFCLNKEIKCQYCGSSLLVDYDEVKKDDDWVWSYWLVLDE